MNAIKLLLCGQFCSRRATTISSAPVRRRELQLLGGIVALAAIARPFASDPRPAELLVRRGGHGRPDPDGLRGHARPDPRQRVHAASLLHRRLAVGEGVRHGRGRLAIAVRALRHGVRPGRLPDRRARGWRPRRRSSRPRSRRVNPLLVWYSQEARIYALLVLLVGAVVPVLHQAADGRPAPAHAGRSGRSSPRSRSRPTTSPRSSWRSRPSGCSPLRAPASDRDRFARPAAVVELAHLPLLLHQRSLDLADFIDEIPLGYRLARTPKQFLVGFDAPGEAISGDRRRL